MTNSGGIKIPNSKDLWQKTLNADPSIKIDYELLCKDRLKEANNRIVRSIEMTAKQGILSCAVSVEDLHMQVSNYKDLLNELDDLGYEVDIETDIWDYVHNINICWAQFNSLEDPGITYK